MRAQEFFEEHALMSGVLIDEIQAIRTLGHQIRATDLPDQAQQRQMSASGLRSG
jgi:hypothetical protein